MKYVAHVKTLLRSIHSVGSIREGTLETGARLPHPDRVEIQLQGGPQNPCSIYRYTNSGDFCGDTWHQNLADAFAQAEYEYGLSESDFVTVRE